MLLKLVLTGATVYPETNDHTYTNGGQGNGLGNGVCHNGNRGAIGSGDGFGNYYGRGYGNGHGRGYAAFDFGVHYRNKTCYSH